MQSWKRLGPTGVLHASCMPHLTCTAEEVVWAAGGQDDEVNILCCHAGHLECSLRGCGCMLTQRLSLRHDMPPPVGRMQLPQTFLVPVFSSSGSFGLFPTVQTPSSPASCCIASPACPFHAHAVTSGMRRGLCRSRLLPAPHGCSVQYIGWSAKHYLMPVRLAIQSSLVSTSFSRSAFVSTASGTLLPQPASLQPATHTTPEDRDVQLACDARLPPMPRALFKALSSLDGGMRALLSCLEITCFMTIPVQAAASCRGGVASPRSSPC